jgi:hypothetical protein
MDEEWVDINHTVVGGWTQLVHVHVCDCAVILYMCVQFMYSVSLCTTVCHLSGLMQSYSAMAYTNDITQLSRASSVGRAQDS